MDNSNEMYYGDFDDSYALYAACQLQEQAEAEELERKYTESIAIYNYYKESSL